MTVFFPLLALTNPVVPTPCRMDGVVDACSQMRKWIIRALLNCSWNMTQQQRIRIWAHILSSKSFSSKPCHSVTLSKFPLALR